MNTLEEVAALLDLPTAEDVANLLRAHGVRGERTYSCSCPIAVFAERLLDGSVSAGPFLLLHEGASVATPLAVRQFIRSFDAFDPAFADLVAP